MGPCPMVSGLKLDADQQSQAQGRQTDVTAMGLQMMMLSPSCRWGWTLCVMIEHMGYGGFLKWGYLQIIHFNGFLPYKPSILGYLHLWNPPIFSDRCNKRNGNLTVGWRKRARWDLQVRRVHGERPAIFSWVPERSSALEFPILPDASPGCSFSVFAFFGNLISIFFAQTVDFPNIENSS